MYTAMQEPMVLVLILCIFFLAEVMPDGASSGPSMSKPGCPDKCGDVSIPYPFGIGEQCSAASLNSYFNLTCNNTLYPPQLTVGDSTSGYYEITNISLEQGEVRVLTPVSYICFTSNTTSTQSSNGFYADVTPFLPSPTRNRFTVIGCNTLGLIGGYKDAASQYVTGCYSYCEDINSTSDSAQCAGMGCCEANIPANLTSFSLGFEMNQSRVWGFNPCFYAMIAEVEWYSFRQQDLVGSHGFIDARAKSGAPLIADWAIRNGSCPEEGKEPPSGYACASTNSNCTAANNGPGYLCQCSKGYEGNPYILNGCQDIDECLLRTQDPKYEELYPCRKGVCHNTQGSYLCKCKMGTRSDGTNFGCQSLHVSTGVAIGLSVSAILLMGMACLYIIRLQRKRHLLEKEEYFRQNGGLKLYEEMRARKVHTIHILTEKEIKRVTDNYNQDRVLGCGGHGMVYRGTLDDHTEVAIKKSKVINDDCREEFVNEIIILSQINHRNIVRLLGCCLDVDVPMLVYEFVSNGTLSEFLHDADRRSEIPLDLRLKIATQSAEALAYLHSSISCTILHGDVKSANILLDDQHNAKIADFGASAQKSMDESEFIMLVQGTLGYLDPESFISHQLTEKSDVYSFGVVLLELITRKRAMFVDNDEKKSLSHMFLLMFRQNKHRAMMDFEIIDEAVMEMLEKLAELAAQCLCPSGDDRPTMKEVVERLQMLRRLHMDATTDYEDSNYAHNNHGGSSPLTKTLDDMTYSSMETSMMIQV
ncbi:hypothetical protein HU200_061025 [Digitaria exilis]|uniref:Protein kinase domain-containing protein n=1 Tax=Digitaria exilis TaxID=1010633 RepID=A0A835E146_9POAL|nr:hypothetical protein HU200_061025 [Digitaria exilis]